MSSSKNFDLQSVFSAGVYLSEAQNPSIRVYSILIHTGNRRGVGELNQRDGERGNSSQSGVENTNMADFISGL
jgi:hypothetical protein